MPTDPALIAQPGLDVARKPSPSPEPYPTRMVVVLCFIGLIALGLLWELWLAPLRPGGSMLALKVAPLVLMLPAVMRGHMKTFQWWSMLILLYLTEGLVRATSDRGLGAPLGWIEAGLSALAFAAILLHVRQARLAAAPSVTPIKPPATR